MVEDTSQNIMQEFIIIFLNGSGNVINNKIVTYMVCLVIHQDRIQ